MPSLTGVGTSGPCAKVHATWLSRLYELLEEMAGSRYFTGSFPNAEEKPVVDAYLAAIGRLRDEGLATFPKGPVGLDSPRARWIGSLDTYQRSPQVYDELMQRYFRPEHAIVHASGSARE